MSKTLGYRQLLRILAIQTNNKNKQDETTRF